MHHSRLKEINRRWHTLLSLQTHVSMDTLYSASTIGAQQLAITAFKMEKIDVIPVCSHFTPFIWYVFSSFAFALNSTFFVVLCVFNSTFPPDVFSCDFRFFRFRFQSNLFFVVVVDVVCYTLMDHNSFFIQFFLRAINVAHRKNVMPEVKWNQKNGWWWWWRWWWWG